MRAIRLVSFCDRDRHGHPLLPYDVYKLNFLCEILLNEEPVLRVDAVEVGVFGEEKLPSL